MNLADSFVYIFRIYTYICELNMRRRRIPPPLYQYIVNVKCIVVRVWVAVRAMRARPIAVNAFACVRCVAFGSDNKRFLIENLYLHICCVYMYVCECDASIFSERQLMCVAQLNIC